jgi:hypothetical protein
MGKQRTSFQTKVARAFGGLLSILSLWQVLSPENRRDVVLGLAGLAVGSLWFMRVPRSVRIGATTALMLWIVVRLAQ